MRARGKRTVLLPTLTGSKVTVAPDKLAKEHPETCLDIDVGSDDLSSL